MTLEVILFAVFASIAVVSSVLVVTRRNPVIAALCLILNFGSLSGMYLLLSAQFIAVVQVIVYAGAIMVLFLFVLMLLRPDAERNFFQHNSVFKWMAIAVSLMTLSLLIYSIVLATLNTPVSPGHSRAVEIGTVEAIGKELFSTFLLPFEAIGFVLLSATVGALLLSKKKLD